jgi:hypothetical protein
MNITFNEEQLKGLHIAYLVTNWSSVVGSLVVCLTFLFFKRKIFPHQIGFCLTLSSFGLSMTMVISSHKDLIKNYPLICQLQGILLNLTQDFW